MSACYNGITFYRFNGEYFTLLSGWTTTTNFELKYDEEFALHTNFAAVVEMCKQFIMFSRIDGEMHEGNILNCVTIATKEYALMAGHCLPKNITEGTQFNVRIFLPYLINYNF